MNHSQSVRHLIRPPIIVCLAGLLSLATSWGQPANPPTAARKPNLIFILADDLGYGDLDCYGQTKIKTPNIDRLAKEGIRFTSFYAGSTVCAPSRCSLMTGLHSGHAVIRGNSRNQALTAQDFTVAELLKRAGYFTGLVGKWGLGEAGSGGVPSKKGFDQFIGFLNQTHAHDYYPDYLWRSDGKGAPEEKFELPQNQGGKKQSYVHDLFTTSALQFVAANKPEKTNQNRPFFLYLAYTIPHANNEEGIRSGNGMQVPDSGPYATESWPEVQKNKAAMITRMDRDIGKLIEKLKDLNIDNDTLVFFSSDNGAHHEGGVDPKFFQSSGQLRGTKRDLYEGGIRVPMIVRWPTKIDPGQQSDSPWAFWDFLPTVAELAGVQAPQHIDGVSFLPTLLGRPQTNHHKFLYWEFHENGFQQAARMGDWKAVRPQADQPLELYNLQTDPGEKQDVAAQQPQVVAKFEEYFRGARTASASWPIKSPKTSVPRPK